jgi:hypothetical protein
VIADVAHRLAERLGELRPGWPRPPPQGVAGAARVGGARVPWRGAHLRSGEKDPASVPIEDIIKQSITIALL